MSEVMRLIGRSLATEVVMREMLHLMSELLGLNRGRIVLCDLLEEQVAEQAGEPPGEQLGKRLGDRVGPQLDHQLGHQSGDPPGDQPGPPSGAAGGCGLCMAEGSRAPRRRAASIRHAYDLTREEMARRSYAPGDGITGWVLASGQPHVVQDFDAEPLFLRRAVPRERLPAETVAFLALPIEVNGRTVGVLACHRIRSRSRQDDVDGADPVALSRAACCTAGSPPGASQHGRLRGRFR